MAARHGGDGSLRHEVQPVNRSLKLKVSLNAFQELIDPLGLCRLHYVQLLGAISGIITSALISPTPNLAAARRRYVKTVLFGQGGTRESPTLANRSVRAQEPAGSPGCARSE